MFLFTWDSLSWDSVKVTILMNMEAFNLQSIAEIPPGELSTHTHHYKTTEPYTLNISTQTINPYSLFFLCCTSETPGTPGT
jgi:hypothetical protein